MGPDQGAAIFDQMLTQQPRITGVLAVNDGLAGAVIRVLKKRGLTGKVQVTGQDATLDGLRAILTGDQCMTVYKNTRSEAQTAANLAIQLFKGSTPAVPDTKIKDSESGTYVPFISLEPVAIDRDNIRSLLQDGSVSARDLCTGQYAKLCATAP